MTAHVEDVQLASLGSFRNGLNFSKHLMGSGLRLINVKDLFQDGPAIDFSSLDRVELSGQRGIEKYHVEAGDLFFVRSSVKRDGIGYVSLARSNHADAVHCGFVIRFRPYKDLVDPLYLTYALRSPQIRDEIRNLSGGAAIINISQESLGRVAISLPPLPEQRRISKMISAYDDLIENNLRRVHVLSEMARALYREWFVDFRFPGHVRTESAAGDGQLPRGWRFDTVGTSCTLIMGQSPSSEHYNFVGDGLPFHQGVTDFGPRFPNNRLFCSVRPRVAEAGDILFSVRAPVGRLNLATTRVVIGRGLAAIRHEGGAQEFLWEQLREKFYEEDMIGNGAIFSAITKKELAGVQLLIPTDDIIHCATTLLRPIHAEIAVLSEAVNNLRRTRDLLLPILCNRVKSNSAEAVDAAASIQ